MPILNAVDVARAISKIRRRLAAHHTRPPALAGRNRICITLPPDQWAALVQAADPAARLALAAQPATEATT